MSQTRQSFYLVIVKKQMILKHLNQVLKNNYKSKKNICLRVNTEPADACIINHTYDENRQKREQRDYN